MAMRGSAENNLQIVSQKKTPKGLKKVQPRLGEGPPVSLFFWGGGHQEGLLTPKEGMEGNGGGLYWLFRAVNGWLLVAEDFSQLKRH